MPERKSEPAVAPLNAKHRLFAEEYLVDLNATQAAKRAGYSAKSAYAQGQRLLKDARVQAVVAELKSTKREANGDLSKRIIQELEIIALSDIGDVLKVDDDGKVSVRNLLELRPEVRRTISEIGQVTTERTVNRRRVRYGAEGSGDDGGDYNQTETEKIRLTVKQHNKLTAINLLMQHFGLLAPVKQEVSVEIRSAKEALTSKLAELRGRVGTPAQSG